MDSMATKLVNPSSQVVHPIPGMGKMVTTHSRSVPAIHPWTKKIRFVVGVRPIHTTKVAEQGPCFVHADNREVKENDKDSRTVEQIKADLYQAVQGINRGIFGVPFTKKSEIRGLWSN